MRGKNQNHEMKNHLFHVILIAAMAAFWSGAAAAQGEVPDEPMFDCGSPESIVVCDQDEASKPGKCSDGVVCHDSGMATGAKMTSPEGGEAILTTSVACTTITANDNPSTPDILYIGPVYYLISPGNYVTYKELGYCLNGVPYTCSSASNPITIKMLAGTDQAGNPAEGYYMKCGIYNFYIGGWSGLSGSGWYNRKLNIYGCQGTDILRGAVNADTLVLGSNPAGTTEQAAGAEGDDFICGDYVTSPNTYKCWVGSNCNNDTAGNQNNDAIWGGLGSDDIWGHGGNDTIYGEYSVSGTGSNFVNGGAGMDTINGGDGDDLLFGGDDTDTIYGEGGNDVLSGCNGADTVWGGDGSDQIKEWLCSRTRGDYPGPAQTQDLGDTLRGHSDQSQMTDGCDVIYGHAGDDDIYLDGEYQSGCHNEYAFGGSGADYIEGGVADMNYLMGEGTLAPGDTGLPGGDTILGGDYAYGEEWIMGEDGDDVIDGRGGDDVIEGRDGHDHLYGGDGCDWIYGQEGPDCIYAGSGDCSVPNPVQSDDGCLDHNEAYGGDDNDTIYGSERADYIWGDDGSDFIQGWGGDDFICTGCEPSPACPGWSVQGNDGNDNIVLLTNELIESNCLMMIGDTVIGEEGDDTLCYLGDGNFVEYAHVTFVGGPGWDCCWCATEESDCSMTDCDEPYVGGSDPCGCIPPGLECTCP